MSLIRKYPHWKTFLVLRALHCFQGDPQGKDFIRGYNFTLIPPFSPPFHCLYGQCRTLVSFRINFQASLYLAIFLQSLTPIFFRSFSPSSTHLFLVFQKGLIPSGLFLNVFSQFLLLEFFPNVSHRAATANQTKGPLSSRR